MNQKWVFDSSGRVSPLLNRDLCFSLDISDRLKVKLYECNEGKNEYQMFSMFDIDDIRKKFQFHPKTNETMCLTQEHHPREDETLRFTSCEDAYENDKGVYDDTSHWVVGEFDGH